MSTGDLPSAIFEAISWPKFWLMQVLVSAVAASHLLYAMVFKSSFIPQLHKASFHKTCESSVKTTAVGATPSEDIAGTH